MGDTLRRNCLASGMVLAGAVLGFPAIGEEAKDAKAEGGPAFEADILPLVEQYCYECHNTFKARGDLDLERFETGEMVVDSIAVWQRLGKRIENGEMPPDDAPEPTEAERKLLLEFINGLKISPADCDQLASEESVSWYPGFVMSRRLNRHEYENTVSHLLGADFALADRFPADGAGGEGFDNNGNALFLSAIQVEKYLDAADYAVEQVLPSRDTQSAVAKRRVAGRSITPFMAKRDQREPSSEGLITAKPGWRHDVNEAARLVISDFMKRAWRRPVTEAEVDRLMELFQQGYDRGHSYREALKFAFKAALVSPNFLFLAEPEPETAGNYELGPFPLASRMSYFLWASMPDEELRRLASEGALRTDDELRRQVKRMLQDPKADALGELFAGQWLGITQLGKTSKPDGERFPEFSESMAESMRQEAALFFNHIVQEDRSLLELLDANYTFANGELAKIYGLSGVEGDGMQRVEFADDRRGGVLGMAAVLTATSHPVRTSPVLRGKWVLEQLLGERVPPPPPNVGELPEEEEAHGQAKTLRERMVAHRKNPECASCHKRMDPIGFGLQNFDPIGRWRDEQRGRPIDAKGTLPSGDTFEGPRELKDVLLKRKDDFIRNLCRKMLGYGLGRSLTKYDQCVVDDCVAALEANDYKPSALFTEIVLSYPFRHRYSGGDANEMHVSKSESE